MGWNIAGWGVAAVGPDARFVGVSGTRGWAAAGFGSEGVIGGRGGGRGGGREAAREAEVRTAEGEAEAEAEAEAEGGVGGRRARGGGG